MFRPLPNEESASLQRIVSQPAFFRCCARPRQVTSGGKANGRLPGETNDYDGAKAQKYEN